MGGYELGRRRPSADLDGKIQNDGVVSVCDGLLSFGGRSKAKRSELRIMGDRMQAMYSKLTKKPNDRHDEEHKP